MPRFEPSVTGTGLVLAFLAACSGEAGHGDVHDARPNPWPGDPADLRLLRHGHRMERIGDAVYSLGGYSWNTDGGGRQVLRHRSGASGTREWVHCADMLRERSFFGSGVVDGQLFAIGETIDRYDAAADRWTTVADTPPLPRSHFATAVIGDRIHVLGGYPLTASGHFVFDAATGQVERLPPPPGFEPGDHFHVLGSLVGRMHAVGGLRAGKMSAAHEAWDGRRWVPRRRPPVPLWAKFAATGVAAGGLYVFWDEGGLRYDARKDAWTKVRRMPVALVMPATITAGGRLLVVGGQRLTGRGPSKGVHIYDVAADRWTTAYGRR